MGAGGDGSRGLKRAKNQGSWTELASKVKDDIKVLRNIWFKKLADGDHAKRLEEFYAPQAEAYDKFREHFLWGRRPLLAALAARLAGRKDLVWVDLGGGTGENVRMMLEEYMAPSAFKKIYIVDLCHSLCEQAKKKVKAHGWKNVEVVEGDACTFVPPGGLQADVVSFSYSLTMIPPFHSAIDAGNSYLKDDGFMGVADFYVSSKYDLPMRQMPWHRRFFWRSIFDTDNIDIGPERRHYLDHHMHRLYEFNSQGPIPYVPYLRAPWYIWIGRKKTTAELMGVEVEEKVEAPPLFPPTFLYSQSWEDPAPDMEVLNINDKDVCLTLTSGGCNTLNLALHGAKVVSVDCNPAQTALLELKMVAIKQLPYELVWKMFGEGVLPEIDEVYHKRLAPWMSETSRNFWDSRLRYFKQGLYYQGGMGALVYFWSWMQVLLFCKGRVQELVSAPTLEDQRRIWNSYWIVRVLTSWPRFIIALISNVLSLVFLNRFVMWYGGGVPLKQLECIKRDGVHIAEYVGRTFHGAALYSHLKTDNYFYLNCMLGRFTKECCPAYLKEENFKRLKAGLVNNVTAASNFFVPELRKRQYTKAIIMDHADWLCTDKQMELVTALRDCIAPGGRVIWRSASLEPPYAAMMAKNGFTVRCIQRFDRMPDTQNLYMDRVNMYASFYVAERKE